MRKIQAYQHLSTHNLYANSKQSTNIQVLQTAIFIIYNKITTKATPILTKITHLFIRK